MSERPAWQPIIAKDSAFDPKHPAWKLWYALLGSPAPAGSDEAADLLTAYQRWYAHELADRVRAGLAILDEHVGGFQYAREVREIIDVIDPTVPDPEGWEF